MSVKMGVVGLGVMGANLARNIESRGFPVVGYDLDAAKTQAFVDGPRQGQRSPARSRPEALMEALERPRRILIMVPAGAPVDSVIAHLQPHLEPGDILIDGGNSFFPDTDRRSDELGERRASTSSARASPAARKARCAVRPSCRAARARRGTRSRRSSARSPRRPTTASRASPTWARAAPATT